MGAQKATGPAEPRDAADSAALEAVLSTLPREAP